MNGCHFGGKRSRGIVLENLSHCLNEPYSLFIKWLESITKSNKNHPIPEELIEHAKVVMNPCQAFFEIKRIPALKEETYSNLIKISKEIKYDDPNTIPILENNEENSTEPSEKKKIQFDQVIKTIIDEDYTDANGRAKKLSKINTFKSSNIPTNYYNINDLCPVPIKKKKYKCYDMSDIF